MVMGTQMHVNKRESSILTSTSEYGGGGEGPYENPEGQLAASFSGCSGGCAVLVEMLLSVCLAAQISTLLTPLFPLDHKTCAKNLV